MDELEKVLNYAIKKEYSNTHDFNKYIEVTLEDATIVVSFMKKQHAEEFMQYHRYLLEDYDFQLESKNLRVDNILYIGEGIEDSNESEDYKLIDVEEISEINSALDDIQSYIYKKHNALHKEAGMYDKMSDEWMETMAKIAPLIDVHNYINSKKRKIQYTIKEKLDISKKK